MKEELEKRIKFLYGRKNERYTTLKEIEEIEEVLERLERLERDLYDYY